jgi:hypothetical protein
MSLEGGGIRASGVGLCCCVLLWPRCVAELARLLRINTKAAFRLSVLLLDLALAVNRPMRQCQVVAAAGADWCYPSTFSG